MAHAVRQASSLHRAVVPLAALPLLLTASTGVIHSVLDARGIESEWLLELHCGCFGSLDLRPYYADVLGLCVLILVGSGGLLWWRQHRTHRPRT